MTPLPQRGTPAGDAILAIRALARNTGGEVQELMTIHVLEALLVRLAVSAHREDFVLKGGVLLAAFAIRRPTRDIDLQATGIANDVDAVAQRISAITAVPLDDGVEFDSTSISARSIRDEDDYHGVRVKLVARLGSARISIGVDVNFGDPIHPPPQLIDIPRIVSAGNQPIRLLGYPLTMVIAEKLVTALERGEANTRWRDFADIYRLSQIHRVSAVELRRSLETVAAYRGVALVSLAPLQQSMAVSAQPKWQAWRTRTRREDDLPEQFTELLRALSTFTDPILYGSSSGTWNPLVRRWE